MKHLIALILVASCAAAAADQPKEPDPSAMPFVTVDIKNRVVDVEGEFCKPYQLLELIATVKAAKEHESILTIKARPQHVHLALLMIDVKPGRPGRWLYDGEKPKAIDPAGDRVSATLIYHEDGRRVERPVSRFVRDMNTKIALPSNEFVFSGSRIDRREGEPPIYAADLSGDVISLVSFGDEMIAWPTAASDDESMLVWEADLDRLPKAGTPVTLRLRPVSPPAKDSTDASKPPTP